MSSSRLRSHLTRDGDAEAIAQANESFVLIGTPLPDLERKDRNESKPVWEQEVRDEQGRRRFHGAFTGGWSAGYFNTVGSKEGWTPSTFVSSRKAAAAAGDGHATLPAASTAARSRPEDYMDEEDLAELEQSRQLSARDEYSATERGRHAQGDVLNDLLGLGGSARGGMNKSDGVQADEQFSGLVAPRSSLGHRILTKMGWKAGWGLGPMITRARRRALEQLYIGTTVTGGNDDDAALVPPPDTPMPGVVDTAQQRQTFGLGWQPSAGGIKGNTGDALQKALDRSHSKHRAGFDISVLEDADDDDQRDIYAADESVKDAIERRRREAERKTIGGSSSKGGLAGVSHGVHLTASSSSTWQDGRPLPPGFTTDNDATSLHSSQEWFAPPKVPQDWRPDPTKVWAQRRSGEVAAAAGPSSSRQMGASDRASMLGEARIPGPPPSMANYLPPPGPPPGPPPKPLQKTVDPPRLDATTARAALNGFIPFGNDEAKQERYKAYLRQQADAERASQPVEIPPGKTAQEVTHHLQEFARSAGIFKPMSSAMSSRFASAATVEGAGDAHAPTPGLYQPAIKTREEREAEQKRKEEEEAERARREVEENMTDRQRAAKAGMFGHLTREVREWFPPRLLCKRFGVPDPHPGREPAAGEGGGDATAKKPPRSEDDPFGGGNRQHERYARSEARREIMRGEARWEKSRRELMGSVAEQKWQEKGGQPIKVSEQEEDASPSSPSSPSRRRPLDIEQVGLGEDERQLREIDSFVKPSRDLFRSVFAEDEGDDDGGGGNAAEVANARTAPSVGEGQAAPEPPTAPPSTSSGPTFTPRFKRAAGEAAKATDTADGLETSVPPAAKRKKEKKKREKKGALTFDMDDGDGEADVAPLKPIKRSRATVAPTETPPSVAEPQPRPVEQNPPAKPGRMRASDLF